MNFAATGVALKTSEYETLTFIDTEEGASEALFGNSELGTVTILPPSPLGHRSPRPVDFNDNEILMEVPVSAEPRNSGTYRVRPPLVPREHILQHWEGRVLEVGDKEFVAGLADLSNGSSEETIEATIPIAELSDEDVAELEVGKIFNWVIGFGFSGSTKTRFSRLVLRRLPAWSERELEQAKTIGDRISSAIRWE